jgi:ABC-type nitrate/sulfonate/bicarbonate transport system ATPase subunit
MPIASSIDQPGTVILEAALLRHSYGPRLIFSDLSFALRRNRIVALMGPNGVGKSSLLKMLAGLLPGHGVRYAPEVHRFTDVSYVDQDPWNSIFPWQRVEESLVYPLRQLGCSGAEISWRVDTVLESFSLLQLRHSFPKALSGGQRQRLAFARAIVTRPQYLFLDESFSATDPKTRRSLITALLRFWREEQFGALFITHNPMEAVSLAHELRFVL